MGWRCPSPDIDDAAPNILELLDFFHDHVQALRRIDKVCAPDRHIREFRSQRDRTDRLRHAVGKIAHDHRQGFAAGALVPAAR